MKRFIAFETREGVAKVVDIASLDGAGSREDFFDGPALHPAYLQQLPDWKVTRADPETDPAQTTPMDR